MVLGLLAWLYLEAELTPAGAGINVVCERRLRPRGIAPPPPCTGRDQRAFQLCTQVEKRAKGDIVVGIGGEDDRGKTSG